MTRSFASTAVAAVLLLLLAVPVLAHAELKTASPGPDDTVQGSPPRLVATFTQNLDPSRTSITVTDAGGKTVAKGGEPGAGKREWRLDLPELAAGVYTVRYTTFSSEDNEVHRGSYAFTVAAAPSPSPSPEPSPSPAASPSPADSPSPEASPSTAASPAPSPSAAPDPADGTSSDSTQTILVIGAALVIVAVVAFALLRRRSA